MQPDNELHDLLALQSVSAGSSRRRPRSRVASSSLAVVAVESSPAAASDHVVDLDEHADAKLEALVALPQQPRPRYGYRSAVLAQQLFGEGRPEPGRYMCCVVGC